MVVWMVYAGVVGALLGAAARVSEVALRGRARPARHVWTVAMALSIGLPMWALLPAPSDPTPAAGAAAVPVLLVERGVAAMPTLAARLELAEPFLLAAWIVASALLAVSVLGGLLRLGRRARGWPVARVGEREVHVSEDFGPALLGLRAPRVVLPRWTLALDDERVRLVVLHEEEHRRAGDGFLLLAGTLATVLAPWNAALWWQLRRLRAAVELDCDARVLRRGASPRTYGRLLLELGSRTPGLPFPVAALSTSRSLLERRLRMIVQRRREGSVVRTALAGAAAVALTVAACEAPAPTALGPDGRTPDAPAAQISPAGSVRALVADATGSEPWIFVDGQRAPEGIPSTLDPEDIDHIEVLKGAAAEAIYGADARHGVVQIHTKGAEVRDGAEPGTLRRISEDAAPAQLSVYVDGEPFSGTLSSIDPETIDRVEVLKGGAAKGGDVVRVVTKKAARGGGKE